MKKKWMVCMIACLMILLAGCNGNIAKETARNDTDKRISLPQYGYGQKRYPIRNMKSISATAKKQNKIQYRTH